MIGKWHLGWDWSKDGKTIDFTKPVVNGPDVNGFDHYYGHCGSLDMPPYVWVDTGQVTAVPDREAGVTSEEDPYGWYRKGPIGSDFYIPEVLPHLFDKSIEYVAAHSDDAKQGKALFSLFASASTAHTNCPSCPFPRCKWTQPIRRFCYAGGPPHG
jgi:arylsulfatase A